MVLFVSIGVQTFELGTFLVALFAEEEVIAVLAHPAMLKHLSFAAEALVAFILLYLRLKYCL